MAERSLGRAIRARRTKLGISQAHLAELVGRTVGTVRSWESDKTVPRDAVALATLSAVLGIDETILFEQVGMTPPVQVETSPTVEEALATLDPEALAAAATPTPAEVESAPEQSTGGSEAVESRPEPVVRSPRHQAPEPQTRPAYVITSPAVPSGLSYVEDPSQRQVYRARSIATMVAVVVLIAGFFWALAQGIDAMGRWWDDFFGQLKL